MYSSPGTPVGTGLPALSSTYSAVLASGVPTVTRSPGASRAAADQMVVSVGP